ncbi:MAG: hypothetical protein A2057_02180 [Ignavibacteria bacterium GWA2_35_9]|nr:MAG: hypothetical protein A2057_02180 [Ignavibacteria bacterium GWA2_35_9]OGU46983.1 MAG: hypothetical protein A2000_04890 [Ignavibacteria bacterium GWB2_36_8]OGU48262.1 MAG: hypothetical protein A2080_13680 [Ignavibacteria bacterium GWC2_36_12]
MDNKELVAIIILNYNKKDDIIECLESIFKMDYKYFEVIVVDNGSHDGSVDAIKNKYPDVHLIESIKNLGASGGRNLGIKYANEKFNYKFILFLDNDITIMRNTLSEMVNSFNLKENIGIVTPKCYQMNLPGTIVYAGGMSVNFFTGNITNIGGGKKDEGQFDQSKFIFACGGLCLVSKNVMDKIEKFDETFNPYGWEDVDLSIRARKFGFKIFYNSRAVVYHKGGKKGRGTISEYEFSKVKNYFYLIRKHANIFQLFTIGFFLPFRGLVIIIKELFAGDVKTLFAQFRGILSLFK